MSGQERVIPAAAMAPGIGIGTVWICREEPLGAGPAGPAGDWQAEWDRFLQARDRALEWVAALKDRLAREGHAEEAALFDAHRLLLEDSALLDPVRERLQAGCSAEQAVAAVVDELAAVFAAMDDEYFRERAADLRDVGRHLQRALTGDKAALPAEGGPWVVVARDVAPSDVAALDLRRTAGLILQEAGPLSHAVIVAKARGLPAVRVDSLREQLAAEPGWPVIVDGTAGRVIVHPDPATVAEYRRRAQAHEDRQARWRAVAAAAARTPDGQQVSVTANIAGLEEALEALAGGADGIGLFRTEFLYMNRSRLPSEDEQVDTYRRVLAAARGRPVVFRTLDFGADKPIPALETAPEPNPALGWRGIRFCMDRVDVFRTQLRALLQAAGGDPLSVMFPMVSLPEEVRRARALLEEVRRELAQEGRQVPETVRVGIMVETPAAALAVDQFAPLVDFFSLGTNDLVQYALGVDRANARVAHLYQAYHPGVLRLVAQCVERALAASRPACVCGEMAGDPRGAVFLLGLGVREFSVVPGAVGQTKELISTIAAAQAREAAQRALAAPDAAAAMAVLESYTVP